MILLLIFIIQVLIFSSNGSITEQRFPTFWYEAPSSISDYPLIGNCSSSQRMNNSECRLIDPWLYLDRLGLYKILIRATTPLMTFCSSSALFDGCNILIGLAAQLGWQFDSNRLFSNGTKQISVNSWWASYNYYLSVIPFLAAVDTGIIRQDSFQIIKRDTFCSNSSECFSQVPEAMTGWRNFFTKLLNSTSCDPGRVDSAAIDHCYLGPMWSAHNYSISFALPIIKSKLLLLPSQKEQRFGLGWVNVLVLLGMARRNTNLIEMNIYQDEYLPKRILTDEDDPPFCPDLPPTVNQALFLLFIIQIESYPQLVEKWKEPTCSYEARKYAQMALYIVPLSKTLAAFYYASAESEVLLFGCDDS